jgi:anti-anti-sigma regulatory factor
MKADIWGDPQDKEQISKLKLAIELKNDFLIWLIEESGELDHTNQDELRERHNKWLDENQ